ncbi:MAG TPA: hypothetical protein VGD17_16465 [Chitinophagaceae bacterium]
MSKLSEAQALEDSIAKTLCSQINAVDLDSLTTVQKKKFLTLCMAKCFQLHKDQIINDPRFAGLSDYDTGKRFGQIVGKNVVFILNKSCPKYRLHFQ